MNRLFYDPLGGPSGDGPEAKPVHPVFKGWDSVKLIGRARERHKELEHKGWDWRAFYSGWIEGRGEMLVEMRKEWDAPESPSPGLRWVKASERLPEKCNDVIIRVIGKPVEVAVGYVADSEEEWAVDGCSWFYYDTEWLDESPSLPGEQEEKPLTELEQQQKEFWYWFDTHFRSASENHDHASTGEKASYWEGYMDAMSAVDNNAPEILAREANASSEEKGEQVEGKGEPDGQSLVICPACGGDGKETCNNPDHGFIEAMPGEIGRLGCPGCGHDPNHKVNRCKNVCPLCGGHGHVIYDAAEDYAKETGYDEEFVPYVSPAPSVEADQGDARRKGLKAFDDSMKNTLGELIEPEENPFAGTVADQQVPEAKMPEHKRALKEWENEQEVVNLIKNWNGTSDTILEKALFDKFDKMQEDIDDLKCDAAGYTTVIRILKEDVKKLRESGRLSSGQWKAKLAEIKAERDEYRAALQFVRLHSRQATRYSVEYTNVGQRAVDALNKFINKQE